MPVNVAKMNKEMAVAEFLIKKKLEAAKAAGAEPAAEQPAATA